jgi:hypothetical protein
MNATRYVGEQFVVIVIVIVIVLVLVLALLGFPYSQRGRGN